MNHFLKTRKLIGKESTTEDRLTGRQSPANQPLSGVGPESIQHTPGGLCASILRRLLTKCGDPPLRIIMPDGHPIGSNETLPCGTIRFSDYRTVLAVALDPMYQFAESYCNGRLEIEGGSLADCLCHIYRQLNRHDTNWSIGRLLTRLRPATSNNLRRSKENIHHHYDIGNDFYRLWLDDQMVYTCAYFENRNTTLEQAQFAKMNHVCRKLRLEPGMRVVEAGCGWGGLAIHMAKHFGARVRAYNISEEQVAWAQDRLNQMGLSRQVEFIQDDWRNIRGQYDAFVSVGMLEHVGPANYRRLGETIRNCLSPKGMGLIHTIGQNSPQRLSPWIERRIFPGAHPPSLKQLMDIFEPNNFSVLDLENLRLHYAETLRHWLERFETSADQIRSKFGERFVRMWRFYLSGSLAAFDSGSLQLFQVLFTDGLSNHTPRTRQYQYENPSNTDPCPFAEHS